MPRSVPTAPSDLVEALDAVPLVDTDPFRAALADTLQGWLDRGDASASDTLKIAHLIGHANARRVYRSDAR